jgi:signal transduction histidine kinase
MQYDSDTLPINMSQALAHEIKNPAALALAHIELLRNASDIVEADKSIIHIERALEHIIDLAQEMLCISHGTPLAFDFNLNEVLHEVIEGYRAARQGVKFNFNPEVDEFIVRAPEMNIRIILSNLIKNAVEANSREVTILVGRRDDFVYIIIRDDGFGLDEIQPKPGSNGLGLPIARWLTQRLGGEITLRRGEKGGCEAVVRLGLS